MPHKHTRRKGGDESNFNLGPSTVARPLSTFDQAKKSKKKPKNALNQSNSDGAKDYKYDDTPRAFARMMQFQTSKKRPASGLDDGQEKRSAKKQKKSTDVNEETTDQTSATQPAKQELPKIQPGERLADFSARVNHALPVGGLARKGKRVEGMQERQTKTEKRLHKMYAEWREQDAKRKEREEEQREQEEEAEEEKEAEFGGQSVSLPASSKKGKRKKAIGEVDGDDDPWAELKLKREKPKGLHDVVQAPPSFKAVPKEKFKVRNNAKVDVMDVPTAAGSLKRREELSAARREVIERYRGMMKKGS